MTDEWITESEARLRMATGTPVDRSKIIRAGDPMPETEETPEPETEETPEETLQEDSAEEAPEEDEPTDEASDEVEPNDEDAEWEETIREAGGDPERDELAEANEVLESNPVDALSATEAKAALASLTKLQLMAVAENDTRKTVKQAASDMLESSSDESSPV